MKGNFTTVFLCYPYNLLIIAGQNKPVDVLRLLSGFDRPGNERLPYQLTHVFARQPLRSPSGQNNAEYTVSINHVSNISSYSPFTR